MKDFNNFSIVVPPEDFKDNISPEMIRRTIEEIFTGTNVCPLRGIIIQVEGYLYPLVAWFDYPSRQIFVSRVMGG